MADIKHLSTVGAHRVGELQGACMAFDFGFSQCKELPQLFKILDADSNEYLVLLGLDNKLYVTLNSSIMAQENRQYHKGGHSPMDMFEALGVDRLTGF